MNTLADLKQLSEEKRVREIEELILFSLREKESVLDLRTVWATEYVQSELKKAGYSFTLDNHVFQIKLD